MLKACIFDLDGVLVDTAKYHFIAWQRLANHLNVEFKICCPVAVYIFKM